VKWERTGGEKYKDTIPELISKGLRKTRKNDNKDTMMAGQRLKPGTSHQNKEHHLGSHLTWATGRQHLEKEICYKEMSGDASRIIASD
jgi:hypothetical protein